MARCIVTGGLGFIGSHVVDRLIERGHKVTIIDDLSTGSIDNLNQQALLHEGDVAEIEQQPRANYVFHLASLARIQPSIKDPMSHHFVNVDGTLAVLEYCRRYNAKIIFSSSSAIYKSSDSKRATNEDDELEPLSPYALQKLICEQYIELYHKLYGLKYAILRYFNVFGERQILEGTYAAVVGIFLNQKAQGKPMTVVGDGSQRRDFTYVKDVAKANNQAMMWKGTFNIGTGKNISILQLAKAINGKIKYVPSRPGEYPTTKADIRRVLERGWQPTKTIMEWIDENKG